MQLSATMSQFDWWREIGLSRENFRPFVSVWQTVSYKACIESLYMLL